MPTSSIPEDVRRWIDQQDADDRLALERTWDLAGLAAEPAPTDTDSAWARLDALLEVSPTDAQPSGLEAWSHREAPGAIGASSTPAPTAILPRRAALWGGFATACAVLGVLFWMRPITVSASEGVRALALPDGSEVTLAPGSELVYRRGLRGDARHVELAGQALFEIASDGRPFVAETFNATVEVLGTEFDVRAWPATETAVVLLEGSVRLRSSAGEVVLRPGELSRVTDSAPTPPAPIQTQAVVAWRDGAFSVVDTPLDAVAAAIEAQFGRPVRLAPGVDADRRLTLHLPSADSADQVLRDLAAYLELRIQIVDDRYDVLPR